MRLRDRCAVEAGRGDWGSVNSRTKSRIPVYGSPAGRAYTGTPPTSRLYRLPKITDMGDGSVTYDPRVALKQPDWTYAAVPEPQRRAG